MFSCEPNSGDPSASAKSDGYAHPHSYFPKGEKLGSKPSVTETPNMTKRMTYVVDKYWWYDGYVSSRENVRQARRGHWYYYYTDGTFMYGKFDKEIGYGTWKMVETADGKEILYNRTEDGSETMQWETMMSNTNDKMVWMGPPIGPNKGDQGMLQPYLQKPTPNDINWARPVIETSVTEEDPLNQ